MYCFTFFQLSDDLDEFLYSCLHFFFLSFLKVLTWPHGKSLVKYFLLPEPFLFLRPQNFTAFSSFQKIHKLYFSNIIYVD